MPSLRNQSEIEARTLGSLHEAWASLESLLRDRENYSGGMQWKIAKGRYYLVRYWSDSTGRKMSKSIGVRSPVTEAQHQKFLSDRSKFQRELQRASDKMKSEAVIAKALKLGRISVMRGEILRAIAASDCAERFMLTGSTAILAYERNSGLVFRHQSVDSNDIETDIDLFVDAEDDIDALEEILVTVDRSFGRVGYRSHVLENAFGLRIDCYTLADREKQIETLYWNQRMVDQIRSAMMSKPIVGLLVDRSGMPVIMQTISPTALLVLKTIRAQEDTLRHDWQRVNDHNQQFILRHVVAALDQPSKHSNHVFQPDGYRRNDFSSDSSEASKELEVSFYGR